MQTCFTALLMALLLAFSPSAFASGKKEMKATVSFHMETDPNDNPKMIFSQLTNGKTRYFRRMPELSTKDIVSFATFPSSSGGEDYGIVFRIKESSTRRFAAVSSINIGHWMVAQLNGRVVDGVYIDKEVNDGRVVIWKGATLADIHLLDASFPRIGQENAKKKKKKWF